ncbi:unnamed protein product [Rotaria sp. Silwood1]|nr:unnamed protein product [Rotaria sp. Silwood1]
MLEQCRYLYIPLGNFPDDPYLFAYQPDLSGKEQDDYRMLLTADVNDNHGNNHMNSNDNMFKNDNKGIHTNKQNHPFEINYSGFYPTSLC